MLISSDLAGFITEKYSLIPLYLVIQLSPDILVCITTMPTPFFYYGFPSIDTY